MRTVPVPRIFWLLALIFAFLPSAPVSAGITVKSFGTVSQGVASIAIGPDGNPHVAYQGSDYHLYHARFDGRGWQRQLVDGTSDCGWGNAIAVDAQGHIHITYGAFRGLGPLELVHAHFDGTAWQVTDTGIDGELTNLQLDAEGQPHVLFQHYGSYHYAVRGDAGWEVESTGLLASPYSDGMVLDANDHAHIAHCVNYGSCFYSTNRSGNWESTALLPIPGGAATAIALDGQGRPLVAIGEQTVLRLFRHDEGTGWSSETIVDFGEVGQAVIESSIAMTTDAQGKPHIFSGVTFFEGDRYAELPVYLFHNGIDWSAQLLKGKNTGLYPSLARADNGLIYGTYCGLGKNPDRVKGSWLQTTLPELAGTWSPVAVSAANGTATVTGTLTVANTGAAKSSAAKVRLYLSVDPALGPDDELLPATLKLKALKPGATATLSVNFQHAAPLSGKYLIAMIDAELTTSDSNMLNNRVPTLLP